MKVALISRSSLYSVPGGDTTQVKATASHLKKIGVEADIKLSQQEINYQDYDLLHFFNVIRPADILKHIKKSNLPYLVSTIYVDYREYELTAQENSRARLYGLLGTNNVEYLKTIARTLKADLRLPCLEYLKNGQEKSIIKVISGASCLLPNSSNEHRRLCNDYPNEANFQIIPNAIEKDLFEYEEAKLQATLANKSGILCVGRIEGVKNQLNLIKAVNKTEHKLTIIGQAAPNHQAYYQECKRIAGSKVQFIDHLSQEELIEYYLKAKVHILASWFETTGLANLEAAMFGCNIVTTDRGDTKEYFKDYADYCDPRDLNSISAALENAMQKDCNLNFRKHILNYYTWEIAAQKTKQAYSEILSKIA